MSIPYLEIEARGSHREIGRQIGEAARELIVAGIAYYEEHHEDMGGPSFAAAQRECLAYLPFARQALPGVVAELEGMAEGAGVALARLLVPNLGEELTCNSDPAAEPPTRLPRFAHNEHCTSVAVRAGGRCLLGHNEDWWAGDVDKNILLRLTTDDGTGILAMTSACLLPPTGTASPRAAIPCTPVTSASACPITSFAATFSSRARWPTPASAPFCQRGPAAPTTSSSMRRGRCSTSRRRRRVRRSSPATTAWCTPTISSIRP